MFEQATIRLLCECDACVKMGVAPTEKIVVMIPDHC